MGVGRGSCARNSTSTTSSTTWTVDCSKGDRKTLKEDDLETSSSSTRTGIPKSGFVASLPTDLVPVDNLPHVDMWGPDEPDIWGALDEGCNSTCHSKTWAIQTEARLKAFGLTFPWLNSNTRSFSGLGATTKTIGKRKLPVCLQLGDQGETLAGVLETHEVDTDALNPLLISLFAQSTLGLVKDMKRCVCWIVDQDGNQQSLPLARCNDTGLNAYQSVMLSY